MIFSQILCKLLRAIPDVSERQRFANQFPEASEVMIECLVAQKDRIALSAFLAKLTPHTIEAYKALNALSNAVCNKMFLFFVTIKIILSS